MPTTSRSSLALLALAFSCVAAQSTATVHIFASSGCAGSHLSCGNIPSNGCCTSGGDVFASAFLQAWGPMPSLQVYSHPACKGVRWETPSLSCFQPSFAFSAARWKNSTIKRDETEDDREDNSPGLEGCRRPDSITLVTDDGEEVKVQIPEGQNTAYEHAFVQGDFAKLLTLAGIDRDFRFFR